MASELCTGVTGIDDSTCGYVANAVYLLQTSDKI